LRSQVQTRIATAKDAVLEVMQEMIKFTQKVQSATAFL